MMKRFTILMLLLSSTNVFAEWTWVDESEHYNAYVDLQTIRKKGNKAKMWSLFDYKTAQIAHDNEYWSARSINEYDCTDATYRSLSFSFLSGKMVTGREILNNNIKGEFEEIPPNSIIETLFKVACSKRK